MDVEGGWGRLWERRSGAVGRQATDVRLGEAKRTKQKWAWLCKGPSSFATREGRSQGWHGMPPICIVGRGFGEAPRAAADTGITTPWSPSKSVLQAVAVYPPHRRSSSLCPEGRACPPPRVPWQLLPTLQGTTKYLDKLFPVSSFPCRCTARRPP